MISILSCELFKHIFRFLNERDRLRFMGTHARFVPLLQERRAVAKEALERLRVTFPKLCFQHNHAMRGWRFYHTYTVRLYRGDPDINVPGDLGLCASLTWGIVTLQGERSLKRIPPSTFSPHGRVRSYVRRPIKTMSGLSRMTKRPRSTLCSLGFRDGWFD